MAAVAALIHRALADGGIEERFVQLETGDQSAAFIFGRPAAVLAVAGRFGLTSSTDSEGPRMNGKEFETRALEELKR